MNFEGFDKLKIGELEAKLPIIQGGMAVGISLSSLASAVANAGGIGVIGTAGIGMFQPDFARNFTDANKIGLRKEIRKAKKLTDGIIGVNIMVALSDFEEMVRVAVEEQADMVFLGAGLPLRGLDILVPGPGKKSRPKSSPSYHLPVRQRLFFNIGRKITIAYRMQLLWKDQWPEAIWVLKRCKLMMKDLIWKKFCLKSSR